MSAKPRVLCVDDEPDLLDGLRLNLRKEFAITTATSGDEGLALFDEAAASDDGPFAAVVSDMRMPNMNGAVFLTKVMQRSAATPRILLSGQADLDSTIAAINDAKIFRFLTKPCEPDLLKDTLNDAMELARLREAERLLLDQTVRGAVNMLVEVLGLASVAAYSRTSRIRDIVTQLAAGLGIEPSWDLDVAAMVSQIGCVVLPEADQTGTAASHADVAANLLENIPRLERVSAIVRAQVAPEPVLTGEPLEAPPDQLDAELLRVAVAYDAAVAAGRSPAKAAETIAGGAHPPHPAITRALAAVRPASDELVETLVEPSEFVAGMELLDDLLTLGGAKLAGAGTVLTAVLIQRVASFLDTVGVQGPVAVMAPRSAVSRLKVR